MGGPLFTEITSAMYESPVKPKIVNYVYGLGGRDISKEEIDGVYKELQEIIKTGKVKKTYNYLGVRGV
jgi:pyruvate ferredoxin oxidoreductase alpha subunit